MTEQQERVLTLAIEFKRICEEHDLWYTLAFGSQLGAYREKGFIQWDDDFDVYIRINDVNNFRKIFSKHLPQNMHLVTRGSKGYSGAFDRLAYKDTNHHIAHVDIFPLVGAPQNKTTCKLFILLAYICFIVFHCKHKETKFSSRHPLFYFLKYLTQIIPDSFIEWTYSKLDSMVDSNTAQNFTHIAGHGTLNYVIPQNYFSKLKIYHFEGIDFWGIEHAPLYLSKVYGADYMTPKKR